MVKAAWLRERLTARETEHGRGKGGVGRRETTERRWRRGAHCRYGSQVTQIGMQIRWKWPNTFHQVIVNYYDRRHMPYTRFLILPYKVGCSLPVLT